MLGESAHDLDKRWICVSVTYRCLLGNFSVGKTKLRTSNSISCMLQETPRNQYVEDSALTLAKSLLISNRPLLTKSAHPKPLHRELGPILLSPPLRKAHLSLLESRPQIPPLTLILTVF